MKKLTNEAIYNRVIRILTEELDEDGILYSDVSMEDIMAEYTEDNAGVEADTYGWEEEIRHIMDFTEIRIYKEIDGLVPDQDDIAQCREGIENGISNEVTRQILLDALEDLEDSPERYIESWGPDPDYEGEF